MIAAPRGNSDESHDRLIEAKKIRVSQALEDICSLRVRLEADLEKETTHYSHIPEADRDQKMKSTKGYHPALQWCRRDLAPINGHNDGACMGGRKGTLT